MSWTTKVIKRYQIANEVCYEKVLDQVGKNRTDSGVCAFAKGDCENGKVLLSELVEPAAAN